MGRPPLLWLLGVGLGLCTSAALPSARAATVEPRVARDVAAAGRAEVILLLADQASLDGVASLRDGDARGWAVYTTLRDHAARSQPGLSSRLAAAGAPVRSFWGVSAIATTVDAPLLARLRADPEVRAVESNAESQWVSRAARGDEGGEEGERGARGSGSGNGGSTWGLDAVRAPSVWELGYTGQGMVIASADTGVDWTHPSLLPRYRGWDGAAAHHDYNWHDSIHGTQGNPCGNDHVAPCDDDGHGTRTTSTAVGDDGLGNRVGVAPSARWMGCRNMDRGFGTPARYLECMEFFLAPTDSQGRNPDPSLRPHVVNNSWGCPNNEGCAPLTLEGLVSNVAASGIVFVVAAGNAGPACSTINDPPSLYEASFTVAATDERGVMAGFSSRGPVLVDASGRRKPDIAAPGVNVVSAIPGGGWGGANGTSLAAPHVSGAVALLWSAHPELIRLVDETRRTFTASARPIVGVTAVESCGGLTSDFTPNDTFGYGALDVLRAVTW